MRVIAGRLEGVVVRTFSTWWRSVAELLEEDEVEDVRVESGEARPRARRRRDFSGILVAVRLRFWRLCARGESERFVSREESARVDGGAGAFALGWLKVRGSVLHLLFADRSS